MTTEATTRTDAADEDPDELAEWVESFDSLLAARGRERAASVLKVLAERASTAGIPRETAITTDYVNTIPVEDEPPFAGDEEMERRFRRLVRWNAAVLVHRAQRSEIAVGGHISTYAGAATLYEVGLNHFFRGPDHPGGGDQVFFQGHASPGMYARAYLEGRLSEEDLNGFRQEKSKAPHGLPSYPHPRLMPHFWQFPTVSMGIGPMNAIFQAQFNRYLRDRGIKDTSDQHVWAFLGDGEMDEPESRGLLQVAANDGLDNLTFVINCNLQRLDGPVRGNGKIVQELEAFFRGAGWNVIKVLWGREWDDLLARDTTGDLVRIMNETLDGDYQTYKGESGSYIRENFFGKSRATKRLVENMSDAQIWALKRGGHDYRKVYAAYHAARVKNGRPTVVLAQTVKGYGLGANFEARNATHQMKKLTAADLKGFRDLMQIPVTDEQIDSNIYDAPYYHPGTDAPEISYMLERRRALGGFLPERRNQPNAITLPDDKAYEGGKKGSGQAACGDHDGLRPAAAGPDARQGDRRPDRADHPGRGAHLRHGLVLPDGQDLQPAGTALHLGRPGAVPGLQGVRARAAAARRHQRGRLDGGLHRRGDELRHARRADDSGLHLLLDVRFPAHRRLHVGGHGPDGARLHHRRDRRPDDADRRGPAACRRPLADPGRDQSGA